MRFAEIQFEKTMAIAMIQILGINTLGEIPSKPHHFGY